MASSTSPAAAAMLAVLVAACAASGAAAAALGLEMHHRFSDRVRRWAEERALLPHGGRWPEEGSVDYYAALASHDRALHRGRGRFLADTGELTFFDGNETFRIGALGFLHYALVELGTPKVTVLVALDTGSDLFWVPCDCELCSSTTSNMFESTSISIYNPTTSSTSQRVSCSSSLCDLQKSCSGATGSCPYFVQYADNSSSVGTLVEDILYLRKEDALSKVVEAPIFFGCGEIQSGSFNAAPYGIFGLGMRNISVPSILSSKGFSSDTFSMCFGRDGRGRMNFGDKGSIDQEETSLNINGKQYMYNISITEVQVGNSSISMEFSAIVDSGTSFTYLADPICTKLSESFNAQVQEKHHASGVPGFDYCYSLSANQTKILLPNVTLTTKGGSIFPFNDPKVFVMTQKHQYFCLAVIKSEGLNIIGQNFMTGLHIVFDRERLILGWKNFNCYDEENSESLVGHHPSVAPVASAFAPRSSPPKAANTRNDNGQVAGAMPPASDSSPSKSRMTVFLLLLLLSLAIL